MNTVDLEHVHKVLSCDTEECKIHIETSDDGDFNTRMLERMRDNARVLAHVEVMLGRKPEYITTRGGALVIT